MVGSATWPPTIFATIVNVSSTGLLIRPGASFSSAHSPVRPPSVKAAGASVIEPDPVEES